MLYVLVILLPLVACQLRNTRQDACDLSMNQLLRHFEKSKVEKITLRSGAPAGEKLHSLTAGQNGPLLLQDTLLIEELAHFARERIPERVMGAKGTGAFGYFEVTRSDLSKYTKASFLNKVGRKTKVFVRFSLGNSERGSPDTVRNAFGFSIKFYTDQGNFDLSGFQVPVYGLSDPLLAPGFAHASRRNPKTGLRDANSIWDFYSLTPSSIQFLLYLYSDIGIPASYRFMDGHGINTYKFVTKRGEGHYCKFHFWTNRGIRKMSPNTARRLAGKDPDYYTRDLYNAIERKEYPSWTLYVQVMTFEEAKLFQFNPFDPTKIWPPRLFPWIEVGQVVLNQNPDNHFADIEQAAFSLSNMPPGIEPSPDRVLQARMFSYSDAQRYRLGVNFQKIPVNRPIAPVNDPTLRDGASVHDYNGGGEPNYCPSSFSNSYTDSIYREQSYRISGQPDVQRAPTEKEDDYTQPRIYWQQTLKQNERTRLVQNLAKDLSQAYDMIQKRIVSLFERVDPALAASLELQLETFRNASKCR